MSGRTARTVSSARKLTPELGDRRWTICPRNLIAGLRAGRTLNVDRRDALELPELLEMQEQGLGASRLAEIDEQSSVLKFRGKAR